MVARNEGWVQRPHRQGAHMGRASLLREAPAPARCPGVIRVRHGEERPDAGIALRSGCGVAQAAEGQGEVGTVLRHALQEVLAELGIALAFDGEANLPSETAEIGRLQARTEGYERLPSGL